MVKKMMIASCIVFCISCNPDVSLSESEMIKVSESFHIALEQAMPDKDLDTILKLYEEDAIYLPMSGTILKGKENIAKGYERTLQNNLASFEMVREALSGDVNHILEIGIINAVFRRDTLEMKGSFKYQNTYRRQTDGSYLMHRAIYNINQN